MLCALLTAPKAEALPSVKRLIDTARKTTQTVPTPKSVTDQGIYEHAFEGVPKDIGPCPEVASRLGRSFSAATGAKVQGAVCLDQNAQGFKIAVRYHSTTPLEPVTTTDPGSIYSDAGYTSREDCRQALADEKARFESHTGLKSAAAYCTQGRFARDDEWTLNITGFGKAQVSPRLDGTFVFGRVKGFSKDSFLSTVKTSLTDLGNDVSFVKLKPSIGYSELSVLYYGHERLRLDVSELAKLDTLEHCEEQLALARQALPEETTVVSYCASMQVGMPFEVTFMFPTREHGTAEAAYETHDTYESCMGAREQMAEYYRGTGREVSGALCSRQNGSWRVMLLD